LQGILFLITQINTMLKGIKSIMFHKICRCKDVKLVVGWSVLVDLWQGGCKNSVINCSSNQQMNKN
jgi:hypothetical protein